MDLMSTATINTYYCSFCVAVKKFASAIFTKIVNVLETIGRARAASQLAQMGHHDLARKVMMGDDL